MSHDYRPKKEQPSESENSSDNSGKTRQKLSKTAERDVSAYRAAQKANPNRRSTISPEGKQGEGFVLSDKGKVVASRLAPEGHAPESHAPERDSTGAKIDFAAQQLHDALNEKWGGFAGPAPNTEKLLNVLETLSADDRKKVEQRQIYKGTTLREDLKAAYGHSYKLNLDLSAPVTSNNSDLIRVENSLLNRPAAQGNLMWASSCLREHQGDKAGMEQALLQSLSVCSSKDLSAMKAHGFDLSQELKNNPNLSTATRHAIELLAVGKDKAYQSGHLRDDIVRKLAKLATDKTAPRPDLFKLAFQSATVTARNEFMSNNGKQKIENAFHGEQRRQAWDYVSTGQQSLLTNLKQNHTEVFGFQTWANKDDIANAMKRVRGTDESKFYQEGEALSHRNVVPNDAHGKFVLSFYKQVNAEMHKAGSQREVQIWEAQLLGSAKIITDTAQLHTDASLSGFTLGGHNSESIYNTLDNLSESDWNRFKAQAKAHSNEDMQRFSNTLKSMNCSDDERNDILRLLKEKIQAPSYKESLKLGHRSIADIGKGNEDWPILEFNHNEKSANKIDAMMKLTDKERIAWRDPSSPVHQKIDQLVHSLHTGLEQDLAKRILDEVKHNKKHDSVDRLCLAQLRGEDAGSIIRELEAAFKENPRVFEGNKDRQLLEAALNYAVIEAGLGEHTEIIDRYSRHVASRYPEFAEAYFKSGQIPLSLKADACPIPALFDSAAKQQRLNDILHCTSAERNLLLQSNPDAMAKAFQDKILGYGETRDFLSCAVKDSSAGKSLSFANQCRAFVMNYGAAQSDIEEQLKHMGQKDKQLASDEYYRNYHRHLADDVLSHCKGADRLLRNEFAEFPVPSEKTIHDAIADRAERREATWDATAAGADQSLENLLKFEREHQKQMTPKEQSSFRDAVEKYREAERAFVESKGKQSEAFMSATTTVLGLAAALIPGVGPAELLGASAAARMAGVAAVSGAVRLAAMRQMEGKDFDGSAENVWKQVFHGSSDAVLCFAGPETLGLKIGGIATKGSLNVELKELQKLGLAAGGKEALALEKALAKETETLSLKDALLGAKGKHEAIENVFRNHLAGASKEQVDAATKAYIAQLKKEAALRVIVSEGKQLGINVGTGSSMAATAQVATDILFPSNGLTPENVWQNCAAAIGSGVAGGAIFHFGFKGLGAGFEGVKGSVGKAVDAAGKDRFYATDGTVVRRHDGSTYVTGEGEKYFLKTGDKIIAPEKTPAQHLRDVREATNRFAESDVLKGRLEAGFEDGGAGNLMDEHGRIKSARSRTVYDSLHDEPYRAFKTEMRDKMDQFKQSHRHASKDELMKQLIQYQEAKLGRQTHKQEADYISFMTAPGNVGKRIKVGDLIESGKLSCAQRATILKDLADEMIGSDYARLVRGDGDGHGKRNHMWVETGAEKAIKIWDPTQVVYGTARENFPNLYRYGSDLKHGVTESVVVGKAVEGQPSWHYAFESADKVTVVNGGIKVLHIGGAEFKSFLKNNPQFKGVEGENVHVSGIDGKPVALKIVGFDRKSGQYILSDVSAQVISAPKADLHKHLLDLVGKAKLKAVGFSDNESELIFQKHSKKGVDYDGALLAVKEVQKRCKEYDRSYRLTMDQKSSIKTYFDCLEKGLKPNHAALQESFVDEAFLSKRQLLSRAWLNLSKDGASEPKLKHEIEELLIGSKDKAKYEQLSARISREHPGLLLETAVPVAPKDDRAHLIKSILADKDLPEAVLSKLRGLKPESKISTETLEQLKSTLDLAKELRIGEELSNAIDKKIDKCAWLIHDANSLDPRLSADKRKAAADLISSTKSQFESCKRTLDKVPESNKPAVAGILKVFLSYPETKINLAAVENPHATPDALHRYCKLLEQTSGSSRCGVTPGDEYANSLDDAIENHLHESKNDKWVYVPSGKGSCADHLGIDGVFISVETGKVVPYDWAMAAGKVAEKQSGPTPSPWAKSVDKPFTNSIYRLVSDLDEILSSPGGAKALETNVLDPSLFASGGLPFPDFSVNPKEIATSNSLLEMEMLLKSIGKEKLEARGLRAETIDYLLSDIRSALPYANTTDLIKGKFGGFEKIMVTPSQVNDALRPADNPRIYNNHGTHQTSIELSTPVASAGVAIKFVKIYQRNGHVMMELQGTNEWGTFKPKTLIMDDAYPKLAARLNEIASKQGGQVKDAVLRNLWVQIVSRAL